MVLPIPPGVGLRVFLRREFCVGAFGQSDIHAQASDPTLGLRLVVLVDKRTVGEECGQGGRESHLNVDGAVRPGG